MTTLRLRSLSRALGLNPSRRAALDGGSQPPGDTEAPTVPQNFVATAVSDDQIDLTWNASTDNVAVTGYNIYRDNVLVDTSPTNSHADTGLDPATEYEYEVSSFDAASNESARSDPDSATTAASGDTEVPSVPQNLSATAISDDQIDLTWDASTDNVGVTGYNIYRDNVLIDTSPTNSYSDTGLASETEYEYEVSAFDAAANESARSDPDSATTAASGDTEAPSVPQNLSATAISDDQINLTWDASTDNVAVTGYNIYRDTVLVDTSPTNSYADTGLDPATEYEYEVSAFDAASNESARSASDSATTPYIATPVNFDGATRLTRGGALTGVSDDKVWSGSIWLRLASTAAFMRAFNALNDAYQLLFFDPSALVLFGKNVGGSIIVRADLAVGDTSWHHLLWSFDLADTGARHFYLDDASVSPWSTYSDDAINFAASDLGIGDYPTAANPWNGDMADVWLRFGGSVIDFSVEANRRLFITADGKPANPAGWPSGGLVGLHGAVNDWHTNKLGGGGFTVTGALGAGTGPVQLP